jgi:hypothetical protein
MRYTIVSSSDSHKSRPILKSAATLINGSVVVTDGGNKMENCQSYGVIPQHLGSSVLIIMIRTIRISIPANFKYMQQRPYKQGKTTFPKGGIRIEIVRQISKTVSKSRTQPACGGNTGGNTINQRFEHEKQ